MVVGSDCDEGDSTIVLLIIIPISLLLVLHFARRSVRRLPPSKPCLIPRFKCSSLAHAKLSAIKEISIISMYLLATLCLLCNNCVERSEHHYSKHKDAHIHHY